VCDPGSIQKEFGMKLISNFISDLKMSSNQLPIIQGKSKVNAVLKQQLFD
jgi:hypothetical protein